MDFELLTAKRFTNFECRNPQLPEVKQDCKTFRDQTLHVLSFRRAPAASGKAGGFLARDWSDGSPIQELQRRSFDLHAEIAEHLDGIDYRRLECVAVAVDGSSSKKPGGKKLEGVEWADIGAVGSRPMGGPDTIAQVHPKKLVSLLRFCVSLLHTAPTALRNRNHAVRGHVAVQPGKGRVQARGG